MTVERLKEPSDECYEQILRTVDRRDDEGDPTFDEPTQELLRLRRDWARKMATFGKAAGIDGKTFLPWAINSAGSL